MGEQLQPEEQKEQQEQQKKNGIMQNIKNNVKEQAKQQAKTQAKQAGLKVTKKVAIKVVSLLFLKPPVCIVTWVIILMIVLSMLLHSVWDAVGDKVNEVVDSITDFFEVDYEFQAGLITISQDEIDKVIKGIQDLGVDIDGLKLMGDPDKVDYSDPDVQEQNKIRLRYYIKRFFEAQAMTQTINTNPNIIEKLLASDPYGSVFIYRPKDNLKDGDPLTKDNIEKMKFEMYDKLKEKIEAPGGQDLTKVFSVNPDGNKLVLVEKQTTGGNTTYSLREIDYENVIAQYTTQMKFFLYLAMVTENPEFAVAVSKMVQAGEIRLVVVYRTTETETTTTERYTLNIETRAEETRFGPVANFSSEEEVVKREKTTQVTPSVVVTYAKTWFTEQEITYNKKETSESSDSGFSNNGEDDAPKHLGENEAGYNTWKTNKRIKIETKTTTTEYVKGTSSEVQDKTGEKGSQGLNDSGDVDENTTFVGLLDDKFPIPGTVRFESAGGNLVSGAESFFSLLAKDEDTQYLEQLMRYILYKYTGRSYGVTEFDFSMYGARDFSTVGGGSLSVFGTTLSREEFISIATAYSTRSSYVKNIVPYLGDFYDVCTKSEYNVNPVLALAHSCLETSYGASKSGNNYFGMAVYNGKSSGRTYSSPRESIEDYCKWVKKHSTVGTQSYASDYARAQEMATVNEKLAGTPDTNIYALYCRYAVLYSNHACNEPDFDHPAGVNYYLSHGDGWGKGGRVYIYIMYEQGSIATGEYKVRCGHPNASDPTTLQEQADFAQYTTDQRIKIAKDIFGDNVFGAGNGETTEGTTSAGGIQVATVTTSSGKTYKRFKQGTGPWAGMGYAGGTMSHSGCNMTCVAIVLSAYGFNDVTPANYAGAMKSADVEIQKKLPGTKLRIRTKGVEKSAYANVQPQHKEDIMNHLATGNPVVFHVLSGSKYTNSQHWMVLVDISGEQVYLIDPGSSKRDGWVDINEVLRYMCCYTKVAP